MQPGFKKEVSKLHFKLFRWEKARQKEVENNKEAKSTMSKFITLLHQANDGIKAQTVNRTTIPLTLGRY